MPGARILRSNIEPVNCAFKTYGEYAWFRLQQLKDDHVCAIEAKTDERLTISELKSRANSISVALINRGITKTDKIAFSGQNSVQHLILRFVSFFTGNTLLPLSPTFETYEVEQEMTASGANIIITSAEDLYKFNTVFEDGQNNNPDNIKLVIVFDGKSDKYVTFEQLLEEGKNQTLNKIPYFDVNPEKDMFFLVHTSGSTGRPKCAMISHESIINAATELSKMTSAKNTGKLIIGMQYPSGHVSGTTMIPLNVLNGATVVLFGKFDEEFLIKSIEKYRINVLPAFPHFGRKLIEGQFADKYDLSSLKVMTTGGAAFPPNIAKAIIDKYGLNFKEAYGMTEYLIAAQSTDPDEEYIPGNAGHVSVGTELKIVDLTTGQTLGPNIDGEIVLRGNKLFSGYLTPEGDVSREAIDKDGWYRTGDIGHYDEKERLFITDRLKEVIRIGVDNHYINISPVEIEQFLLSHKSIAEVSVVGVNNRSGTHWPRAYVVVKEGETISEEEIQKYVSDTLAYTKQLKGGVVFVDSIQRTSIGKVDRKYYRNLVKDEIID